MGLASADYVGPINRLQEALQLRADRVMHWREAPGGFVVDIVGGKLLLSLLQYKCAKLTVICEATVNTADGPRVVERGRRVVSFGSVARMYAIAHDLATYGIRSGPSDLEAQWVWADFEQDRSRRVSVPDGELRMSCPRRPEGRYALIHEVHSHMELLGLDSEAALAKKAPLLWEKRRAKPLQVVLEGKVANLRPLEVDGLIGYHPITDNTFVALIRAEDADDALLLCYVDGVYPSHVVKVSWDQALYGEPFDVDELLHGGSEPANHGLANNDEVTEPPAPAPAPQPESRAPGVSGARTSCPPGCTPMSEPQRELCQRYLKRLHRRLRRRGARKARQLVLLILDALEWCRHDLTGTRQEVNSALEQVLGHHLPGEDRNIRDAIDLLVKYSLFAHREDPQNATRCTFVLSQFHDPNSELMRRIAADEAAELAVAAAGVAGEHAGAPAPPLSGITDAIQDRGIAEPDPTPGEPLSTTPETATATASSAPRTNSATKVGSAQTSQTATRESSAHVFHALVQGPARHESRPFGRGDACMSKDAPIVAQPVHSRAYDTALRGFTDHFVRTGPDGDPNLGAPNVWDSKHKKERPDGSHDDGEPGD